jgi:hypothetical protein
MVPYEFNARMDTRTAVYIPDPGSLPHVVPVSLQVRRGVPNLVYA